MSIKRFIRLVQRKTREHGVEIRKTPADYRHLKVFKLVVQALMARRGEALRFVQVGANDGVFGDPLRPYVLAHGWTGVLVEPQADVFEKLKANYAECGDRLKFENVAISRGESLTLYLPPEEMLTPEGSTRVQAVVSANPDTIGGQEGVEKARLRKVEVPAMTLDALVEKHGITELDLLQIDAEGFDWQVLQTLDLDKLKPIAIQMETGHLGRGDLQEMASHLNAKGYDFYYGGYQGDGVAVLTEFVEQV